MKRMFAIGVAVVMGISSYGQTFNNRTWSYNILLGGSGLLGDLGGGVGNGSIGPKDIDLRGTRPAIGFGFTRHNRQLSLGMNLLATRLVGSDEYSQSESREVRNLSVRTDLIELNLISEFRPFRHTFMKRMYLTAGVGGIYYQPKAELNDEWIKLRELGTEGQLMTDNTTYSKFDIVIPYGLGYKFPLGENSTLNLDLTMRKSFTDYLDDVSGAYPNLAALAESNGDIAALLSNRSGQDVAEGSIRGSSLYKDHYFVVGLKFEKTIGSKKAGCFYDDTSIKQQRRIRKHQRGMFSR